MTEKNLIPVPDGEGRRAAARRARLERRRAVVEQKEGKGEQSLVQSGEEGGKAATVAQMNSPAAALQAQAFVLPPRAQIKKGASRFGHFIRMMFLIFVAAPTVLTILFYGFIAANQYATFSSFAVRGANSTGSAVDVTTMFALGGTSADTEVADSFIVQEYIQSREMVEILIAEANFLEIYSRPSADPYYRLNPELPIEDLVAYWQMMSTVEFDTETGIIDLIVRAFRPSDVEQITRKVIEKSEALVNLLSLRSREDSLRSARRELQLAEERYSEARKEVARWRGSEREIDPEAVATAQTALVSGLEVQLADLQSNLIALRATMSENSPRVVYVRNQIEALKRQIATERLSVAVADADQSQPVLTERLARYEELLAEREFAQQSYSSSLAALEQARMEALKQQRYLAVFVTGMAPQESTYPKGIRWTLIVFGVLFLSWGLFALVAAAIRDRVV
ncbi:MAG: RkpR [Acuticoccus sp.]